MMKYYRHSVLVEWVSNEPWNGGPDLAAISYEIMEGGSIGTTETIISNHEISRSDAIAAEITYGGDGTFIIAGES